MCTIPPVPPPPPALLPISLSTESPEKRELINPRNKYSNVCLWASDHPELLEACAKHSICLHKTPFKYKYKHFDSILQVGPTCGLVALSMILNGEVTANEMLNITKMEGYSNNGEMFSCKDMMKLIEKVFSLAEVENVSYNLIKGGLFSHETVQSLLEGAVLLVAYDADFNHSPCLKQGHKAHWALVCGVIVMDNTNELYNSNPDNVYVLCKHGKSRHLAVWKLEELDKSNKNLWEFSPNRSEDGLIYILPDGGVGGKNGLREQFLLFNGL